MAKVIANAEYWQRLAEKARDQARMLSNSRAAQILLDLASAYDQLAEQAERHANYNKAIDEPPK